MARQEAIPTKKQQIIDAGGLLIEPSGFGKNEWRIIKGHEARDYDGEPSGWLPGTPPGDRELVECKFVPNNPKQEPRYTNYW